MSAQEVITLKGIEEALGNLDYRNENALKSRLIGTLMGYYGDGGSPESMDPIPAEELIASLWGVRDDPETLRNKRKNLSSIKASVNTDLRRLYREGRNPEGIVIGPGNFFVISDEAKDELLRAFKVRTEGTGRASLGEIREVLAVMNGILSGRSLPEARETGGNGDFQAIRDLVKSLSEKVGAAGPEPGEGLRGKGAELGRVENKGDTGAAGSGEDVGTASSGSDTGGVSEDLTARGAGPGGHGVSGVAADPGGPVEAGSTGQLGLAPTEMEEAEEPEDALEAVEIEEIEGEVVDLLEEEVPEDEAVARGLGSDAPEVESLEAMEGFLEGEQYDELEIVEAEEDPDEVEVLEVHIDIDSGYAMEGFLEGDPCEDPEFLEVEEDLEEVEISGTATDGEEISESDVYTEVEEVEAPEDLSQESGYEGDSASAEPPGEPRGGGEGPGGPGVGTLPPGSSNEVSGTGGEPGAFPNEEGPGGLGENPSGDDTPIPVPDEGAPLSPEKAKVLAEAFNRSLAAMDRHYNQHLLIPAGEYRVGSGKPSRGERAEERVRLDAFYMGKFPVTNAIFEVFVERTGYRTTAERCGHGTVYAGRCLRRVDERTGKATFTWSSALGSRVVRGACWYQPSGPGSTLRGKRNRPVVQVSLEDALAFAAWTGKKLPTEEEWEAASRTPAGFRYPWGEEFRPEACNLEASCMGETTAVDRYPAGENAFGIVDTLGNVHEWTCQRAGSGDAGEAGSAYFIVKGGSWVAGAPICLWSRMALDRDSHSNILGFRCVAY